MKKNFMVWIMAIALMVSILFPAKVMAEAPQAVLDTSIRLVKDREESKFVFKWDAVPNATGYQVCVIDAELYDYDEVVYTYSRATTYKNSIKIKVPSADETMAIKVRVRPFTTGGGLGKRQYGAWSVGTISYYCYFY